MFDDGWSDISGSVVIQPSVRYMLGFVVVQPSESLDG